jgi:hypothetical protein
MLILHGAFPAGTSITEYAVLEVLPIAVAVVLVGIALEVLYAHRTSRS